MTRRSTSVIDGQAAGPMQTRLSAEEFAAACRYLVDQHEGHELHRRMDLLVCDLLTSWGFGEGVEIFLANAVPYHSPRTGEN